MGYAIADGIARKGLFSKNRIVFFENNLNRIDFLRKKKYFVDNNAINTITKNKKDIEAIILAVKPYDLEEATKLLKNSIPRTTLIISVLAGVKIKDIELHLNNRLPIVRVMPNTPCQIGKGISVLAYNKNVNEKRKDLARKIFSSLGKIIEANENHLDAVTALSGSGPAYFCYFIESLTSGGKRLGLSQKVSYDLALQTAIGTLLLLDKRNLKPEVLRKSVTSPKGTTEAALQIFKKKDLNKLIFLGLKAAKDRSVELGKLSK